MNQNRLNFKSFSFNSPEVLNLRDKILKQGTLIKDLDIQINYGIKTGYNKAFIIDESTKNRLINEDSKNKEIIKPLLRGRDLDKWKYFYKNLYILIIKYGEGENIKNNYKSIFDYLEQHDIKLKNRGQVKNGQHHWLELDNNPSDNYIALFEKEKIMYSEIVPEPRFILDYGTYYMEATGFILNSDSLNLKYLLGLLNSKLLFWYFKDIGYNLGGKGYRYKKIFIEQLPVKFTNESTENKVNNIVDKLITLNKQVVDEIKRFKIILIEKYNLKHISKNLEKYYELTEKNFFNELKKQKCYIYDEEKLTLYFKTSSKNILSLIDEIKKLEIDLNKIVYEIYSLNDDEIKIIENSS